MSEPFGGSGTQTRFASIKCQMLSTTLHPPKRRQVTANSITYNHLNDLGNEANSRNGLKGSLHTLPSPGIIQILPGACAVGFRDVGNAPFYLSFSSNSEDNIVLYVNFSQQSNPPNVLYEAHYIRILLYLPHAW